MKFMRGKVSVTKPVLSVTEKGVQKGVSVTKSGLSVTDLPLSVTKDLGNVTLTVTDKLDKLRFTDETLEERIEIYKKIMGEITFVPNWILHGFPSKEDAIKHVIDEVRKRE